MTTRARVTVIVHKYHFTDMWTRTNGHPGHTYVGDAYNTAYHASKDVTGRNRDEVVKKANKWAEAVIDYFRCDSDYAKTEIYFHFNEHDHCMKTIDMAETPTVPDGF